jgi:hypothetical protein
MKFTAAPAGSSWCEEAYIITVSDAQPQHETPISSSSTLRNNGAAVVAVGSSTTNTRQLGRLLLLFDLHYGGLPYTTTVRLLDWWLAGCLTSVLNAIPYTHE